MTFFLRSFLLLVLAGTLTGCTGGNFLIGKWTFDSEATAAGIEAASTEDSEAGGPAGGFLKGIVGGLQKGMRSLVVSQLDGTDIEFTRDEMRRVQNGAGLSQGYEIIEKVSPDRYLVKYEDGDIVTWGKTEGGIMMQFGPEQNVWVHFRPAEG